MLKEIYEQPAVIGDTLNSFVNPTTGQIALPTEVMEALRGTRITLIACGTAYYAASVFAKYWFEQIAYSG